MFEGMSKFQAMKQTSESTSKQIEMAVALNESCFLRLWVSQTCFCSYHRLYLKKKKKKKKREKLLCPWLLLKVGLADYLSFTIYLY